MKPASTLLFQGDSITDAGRNFADRGPNSPLALGHGYVLRVFEALQRKPEQPPRVLNRGISGNRVPDLQARWQRDCVALAPDVLSILIGVNDIWHGLSGEFGGTVQDYRSDFAQLLEATRAALPNVKLVICEPFVLRCGVVDERWFPQFDERRAIARELAQHAGATFVPFQQLFDDAVAAGAPPDALAADGVHPTPDGHARMAEIWLEVTHGLLS